jgi:hypothetical protein
MSRFAVQLALLPLFAGLAGTPAAADVLTAAGRVTLPDVAGDVDTSGGPALDVTGLTIETDGKQVLFTVHLASSAGPILAKTNDAGAVATVYVDTDDDPATGVTTVFGRKPGFELQLELKACIEYESGHACGGGLGKVQQTGYFGAWGVSRAEGDAFKRVHDIFWESPRTPLDGKVLTAAVPYPELGLTPGKTVRMAVLEAGAGYDESAFLPEVRLAVK